MNILLQRIGRLGDMVMILPALKELKRLYPQAHFYFITGTDGIRLLKLIGIPKENIWVYRQSLWWRWFDRLTLQRYLKQMPFHKIYSFECSRKKSALLPSTAYLIDNKPSTLHYAARALSLVNPSFDVSSTSHYLPLPTDALNDPLNDLFKQHQITPTTILVGFHPTFSGWNRLGNKQDKKHRLWPRTHFAALALKLSHYAKERGLDLKIIINVLDEELFIAQDIINLSKGAVRLIPNVISFEQYLALLQRLQLMIVANTGVLHLTAALNTPMVALFSGGDPEDCGPYMPKDKFTVLRAEDTAHPDLGLAALTVDQVFDAALHVLGIGE